MRHEVFLKHRLHTLRTLHDAVSAMRSLSAHHFRIIRQGLQSARTYREEIERIVAEIGIHQPPSATAPTGLLVVGSDLGLCGDYNSQLARRTIAECQRREFGPVYSVGRRLRPALAHAGVELQRNYDAPASLDGLARLLLQLAQDLMEDYSSGKIGGLDVAAARFDGVGHFTPMFTRLLPINPVQAIVPLLGSPYVSTGHLRSVAVREYVYISLHEVLMDALTAEHGMRLTAAEAALQWIEETTAQAAQKLSASRSETATQELLDLVSGAKQRRRTQ